MRRLLDEQVLSIRRASREMVRELGFLQSAYTPAGISHSQCHALVEIEEGGVSLTRLSARLRLDKSTTSRLLGSLARRNWVRSQSDFADRRRSTVIISPSGRRELEVIHRLANARVQSALKLLSTAERKTLLKGLSLYAGALTRSRARAGYQIRLIRKSDDRPVEHLLRRVMPEFGACGPGSANHAAEVTNMYRAYHRSGSRYWVVTDGKKVLGGGGIAPLAGGPVHTCELRKMYFLPELRGLGLGQALIERCLEAARQEGYRRCYLETLKTMLQARRLYRKNGFRPLVRPIGCAGHSGCDAWYARHL